MSKRRAIISYDKLSIDQKKQILRDYPDGYINHLTTIKTPTGETLDALIWETDEVIYLVKVSKIIPKLKPVAEVDEDDFDGDTLDKVNFDKDVYVVEGPIDSMFIENSIAMVGADLDKEFFLSKPKTLLNTQPRRKTNTRVNIVSNKPSLPTSSALLMFIPKPSPIIET